MTKNNHPSAYSSILVTILWMLLLNGYHCPIYSQEVKAPYFISPVDHEIKLSGSFGELRSNHFHSGIDIKSSNGREGDTIRAVADGFISRIKIEYGGYGKAIYIDHPNGMTSVYAHMNILADSIASYVLAHQRSVEKYAVDITVPHGVIPIKQGEYIALLGNVGKSYGPHLHFELRHTVSEKTVNPFEYNLKPIDTRKPVLNQVYATVMTPDFQINDRILLSSKKDSFEIAAWRVGISFNGYDLMNGANNQNGIYAISLTVDDKMIYTMKVDSFGFDETRTINAVIDYEHKKNDNQTLVQCYQLPGNGCSLIKSVDEHGGLILLSKDAYRKIKLKLYDYDKNITEREFYVKRKEIMKTYESPTYHKLLKVNETNLISHKGFQLNVGKESLFANCYLRYAYKTCNTCEELVSIELGDKTTAINSPMHLFIQLDTLSTLLYDKLVIVNTDTNTSYGGNCTSKVIDTKVDALGHYAVMIDTIAPTINVVNNSLSTRGTLVLKIEDNLDTRGEANDLEYQVLFNESWQVAAYSSHSKLLSISVDKSQMTPSNNSIKVTVWDDRTNKKMQVFRF